MRGRFIVLEGLDGVGKTTLAHAIAERIGAVYMREPGGSAVSEQIRNVLKSKEAGVEDNPAAELMLAWAARLYNVPRIIEMLDDGVDVVCDRWVISTVLYQGQSESLIDDILTLHDKLKEDIFPDYTIILETKNKATPDQMVARGAYDHLDERGARLSETVDWKDPFWAEFAENTLYIERDDLTEDVMGIVDAFINPNS